MMQLPVNNSALQIVMLQTVNKENKEMYIIHPKVQLVIKKIIK